MPFTTTNARLELFKVGTSTANGPDRTISAVDILETEFTRRINRRKDSGSITLANDDGKFTSNAPQGGDIVAGDRLDFYVDFGDGRVYGAGEYGDGAYGVGPKSEFRWSALVRNPEYERLGPNRSLFHAEIEDFAFGVMAMRDAYNVFDDRSVAGSSDAILNTLLTNECPELDTSKLQSVSHKTSYTADGTNVLEIGVDLASRANAVMYSRKDSLVFEAKSGVVDKGTLAPNDIGTFSAPEKDSGIANSVRVDGGTDYSLDDEQTTQNGYTTVDSSNRLTFRVDTRKSMLDRVELWTNPTGTNSAEDVTVRVQKDDGGAPVDEGDESSDVVNKTLASDFLADDGFTTFLFGDHTLPEPRPWIIVESDGSTGQEIGVDTGSTSESGDDQAAYKAHYRFGITVRLEDLPSQDNYRQRDQRIKKENVVSTSEARAVADEKLNHDASPNPELNASALSDTARKLEPADKVTMPSAFARERVNGDYLVTEISDSYTAAKLNTTIKFVEVESV